MKISRTLVATILCILLWQVMSHIFGWSYLISVLVLIPTTFALFFLVILVVKYGRDTAFASKLTWLFTAESDKPNSIQEPNPEYRPTVVKRIQVSEDDYIEIFQRPSGSFGYRNTSSTGMSFGGHYAGSTGSAYDTAEKAEKYARGELH